MPGARVYPEEPRQRRSVPLPVILTSHAAKIGHLERSTLPTSALSLAETPALDRLHASLTEMYPHLPPQPFRSLATSATRRPNLEPFTMKIESIEAVAAVSANGGSTVTADAPNASVQAGPPQRSYCRRASHEEWLVEPSPHPQITLRARQMPASILSRIFPLNGSDPRNFATGAAMLARCTGLPTIRASAHATSLAEYAIYGQQPHVGTGDATRPACDGIGRIAPCAPSRCSRRLRMC